MCTSNALIPYSLVSSAYSEMQAVHVSIQTYWDKMKVKEGSDLQHGQHWRCEMANHVAA